MVLYLDAVCCPSVCLRARPAPCRSEWYRPARHRTTGRAAVVFGVCSDYLPPMSTAVQQLRQALERRFPDALPLGTALAPAIGTGVPALDLMLPGGGLARGRVTTWRPGGGATGVLRMAV